MTGRLAGKVAFISGAARGQGRSHAVRLAQEGADIIAFDLCQAVESQGNPGATPEDLAETVALVEKLDRRIVARQADARDKSAVRAVLDEGIAEFGRLDVVVANHGITGVAEKIHLTRESDWRNVLDHNLTGIWNVVTAGIRVLEPQGTGGSVIITSSSTGLRAVQNLGAYAAAKTALLGLTRALAHEFAEKWIRVNAVVPTAVSTPMIHNDNTYRIFRPDLENPTAADTTDTFTRQNLLPIPWVEPVDISNGVLFLASDEARYVTGIALPIDAGCVIR